jgi:serine/threonine protein phosphatase PrpC
LLCKVKVSIEEFMPTAISKNSDLYPIYPLNPGTKNDELPEKDMAATATENTDMDSTSYDAGKSQQVMQEGLQSQALKAQVERAMQDLPPFYREEVKMQNNLVEAMQKAGFEKSLIQRIVNDAKQTGPNLPLNFSCHEAELKGRRKEMEDAHFLEKIGENRLVAGVFDGHGDSGRIASFAAKRMKESFVQELVAVNGNVRLAFSQLINKIHQEVEDKKQADPDKLFGGTTALVCYIDGNRIYTSTLGDSEATLYRKIDSKIYAIPLSLIRDWSYFKDANRAAEAMQMPTIKEEWPIETNSKLLRFPDPIWGINVSRAIGDQEYQRLLADPSLPGVIQKTKVTMFEGLKPGDIIELSCDGVGDFLDRNKIINEVLKPNWNNPTVNLAEKIKDLSYNSGKSQDNITVLTIRVSE